MGKAHLKPSRATSWMNPADPVREPAAGRLDLREDADTMFSSPAILPTASPPQWLVSPRQLQTAHPMMRIIC